MTFDEYQALVAASTPDDWNVIATWGARSGPSYRDQFRPVHRGGGYELDHQEHSLRAAYKPNLSVTLAAGLYLDPERENDFNEPWHQKFPDKQASAHFVDFFYYGDLIDRQVYVSVDGGRANLPLPRKQVEDPYGKARVTGYWITRWQYDFFKTFDRLERQSEFDHYVEQAGFEIRG